MVFRATPTETRLTLPTPSRHGESALHAATGDPTQELYDEVGSIAMTLIETKIKRERKKR